MVLLSEDKAKAVAEVLNRGEDEDWTYEVYKYNKYRFAIKTFDENNEFLGHL